MIKAYQNPQPFAIDRLSKVKSLPSHLAGSGYKRNSLSLDTSQISNQAIFKNEAEDEAWRDALEKGNPID